MEVIETQKRKTKLIEVSFFNILRTERRKTEMTIRILLYKIAGKQKTKTDGSNSIFNVVRKRKTKTEPRVLFSDDVGKKKETGSSNSVFLFRRKTVGTKVHDNLVLSTELTM